MKIRLGHIADAAKRGIQKKGFHAVVDQGIISGINFLTFLLLARWMEMTDFGQYILTYSVLVFVQTIQHALITRAHNVLGAKENATEYGPFTRSVLKLVMAFGSGVTILFLLLSLAFEQVSLLAWGVSSLALAMTFIPWLLQDAIRRVLYTSERIGGAAVNDAICYLLQLGLIVVCMTSGVPGTQLVVFSILSASSLFAALVGFIQIRGMLTRFFSEHTGIRTTAGKLWQFGKWLTTGEFIGWIGQNGNTWIIGALMGAPLVAGYRAATYVTNLLNPLDLSVSNYLPVKAAQIAQNEGRPAMLQWLKRQALMLCVPYAVLVLGISIGSMLLLDLFFDQRYVTELFAVVLSISALGRLAGFAVNFARLGLMATENNRPILLSQILSLFVFLTVSLGMISWLGVMGAPLARIVLHVVLGAYLTYSLVKPSLDSKLDVRTVPS